MQQGIYTIQENSRIARGIYRMVLSGETGCFRNPGQFVNIKLEGRFLRRPISVADYDEKSLTLLYKVVGGGTDQMSQMRVGEALDLLAGLGNGFTVVGAKKPLLIGGGIGAAPLYGLCKQIMHRNEDAMNGTSVTVVLGAATKEDLYYVNEFQALGAEVIIATDDGSEGVHGFVTDAIEVQRSKLKGQGSCFDYYYCCGPMPMMKAVKRLCDDIAKDLDGQFSLEERMGCGFGACMGCSVQVTGSREQGASDIQYKRVCKDGPVFKKGELLW